MPVLLFDLDGTLIDVSGSYDFAVARTVELYCKKVAGLSVEGELVTFDELAALRSAGGFNNDWDLAAGLTIWALDQYRGGGAGVSIDHAVYKGLPSVIDGIRGAGGGLIGLGDFVEAIQRSDGRTRRFHHPHQPSCAHIPRGLSGGTVPHYTRSSERILGGAGCVPAGKAVAKRDSVRRVGPAGFAGHSDRPAQARGRACGVDVERVVESQAWS